MVDHGSITRLIASLQQGQEVSEAQQELWDRYFHRLVGLARVKLQGVRRTSEDEEDVALSVLKSLFVRLGDQRLPLVRDRHNLWPLLVKITACKAINLRQRLHAAKRGGGRPARGDSFWTGEDASRWIDQVVAKEPTPEFAVEVMEQYERLVALLPDATMRTVAQRKIEGFTNAEIADQLGVVARTVERKLRLIREIWERDLRSLAADHGP